MSSLLQVAIAEQEMRSDQGQHGGPGRPGQTVRLVQADALRPQRLQRGAAAFSATVCRHHDEAERAVDCAEPPPHLAEPSRQTLQGGERDSERKPPGETRGSPARRRLCSVPERPVDTPAPGWCQAG